MACHYVPGCRGATPDLQDAQGSTALHLLIVRTVKEKFWPDLEPEAAFQVACFFLNLFLKLVCRRLACCLGAVPRPALPTTIPAAQMPPLPACLQSCNHASVPARLLSCSCCVQGVNLDDMYRDDERTDYLEGLGTVLLRAGWSLDLPNARGRTARQLLRVGQQHARAKRAKAEHVAAGRSGFAAYFGSADIQQQILRQVARAKRLERVLQDLENVQP